MREIGGTKVGSNLGEIERGLNLEEIESCTNGDVSRDVKEWGKGKGEVERKHGDEVDRSRVDTRALGQDIGPIKAIG